MKIIKYVHTLHDFISNSWCFYKQTMILPSTPTEQITTMMHEGSRVFKWCRVVVCTDVAEGFSHPQTVLSLRSGLLFSPICPPLNCPTCSPVFPILFPICITFESMDIVILCVFQCMWQLQSHSIPCNHHHQSHQQYINSVLPINLTE